MIPMGWPSDCEVGYAVFNCCVGQALATVTGGLDTSAAHEKLSRRHFLYELRL